MAKTGIGVIGLGRMGQVYGDHVARQVDNAMLVAVADPRTEALTQFSSSVSSVTTYTDYHELLANPKVEGVIIASPTSTHRDVVIDAAAAKKAIFCEKPTALTLKATDEMIDAVRKAGVLFQVGFMRRFDAGYADAKRKIEAGIIGQPITIRSVGRDPFRTSLEYANPKVSGGIVVDMGIHDFDLVRWLMNDEVERVYTEAASLVYPELREVGDVDNAMINLRLVGGGLGNVEVSRTAIYGYDVHAEVIGTQGALHIGYLRETPLLVLTKAGVTHDVVAHFPERFGPAYSKQIEHFVESVTTGQAPMVTPQDARAALQIALAATVSQHEGRMVYVKDVQA